MALERDKAAVEGVMDERWRMARILAVTAARLVQIAMDARDDPALLARFWREATDWTVHEVVDSFACGRARASGPYLEFVRTPTAETVKNRIHLDLRPYPGDDHTAEVARLLALGATLADVGQGDVPWTVLADPEGSEFCLLAPR